MNKWSIIIIIRAVLASTGQQQIKDLVMIIRSSYQVLFDKRYWQKSLEWLLSERSCFITLTILDTGLAALNVLPEW